MMNKEKELKEAYLDIGRVQKMLKKAVDEGKITKDIELILNQKLNKTGENNQLGTGTELADINRLMTKDEFRILWEGNMKGHIRPMLLAKV